MTTMPHMSAILLSFICSWLIVYPIITITFLSKISYNNFIQFTIVAAVVVVGTHFLLHSNEEVSVVFHRRNRINFIITYYMYCAQKLLLIAVIEAFDFNVQNIDLCPISIYYTFRECVSLVQ